MKKFFALVLAVAMVMSLSAVAMAADTTDISLAWGTSDVLAYDYSADSDKMTAALGFDANGNGALLTYGDTAYFPIHMENEHIGDYALVEKLKVKVAYEMGEDLVEDVAVVKKAVGGEYKYFLAFKTVSKATTADADVIGTVEFSRKALKKDDIGNLNPALCYEIDDVEIDFAFNLFYENSWLKGAKRDVYVKGDQAKLKWDTDYALKFEGDDEVEFTFGTEENEGTFNVDISGQGKVYLRYNTKADEAIVAANPGVDMHFINFNGAKFNRTGEFTYEMEDVVAAYKVVDGALVEIAGLEVEDDEVVFNTRVLESYVFADAELVNPVVEAPVVAPEVTNPTTGA